ncbi:MAG: exosortase/archaeosortase family protein [Verrucomicrobiales bacterium]
MTEEKSQKPTLIQEFFREFPGIWKSIPDKGLFVALLAGWLFFFDYFGNSTLGYIDTRSLIGWACYAYDNSPDDEHGFFIPIVVLALFWWKRKSLSALPKQNWLPALFIILIALAMHFVGYFIQQTRLSLAGLFLGLYGMIGLVWGKQILKASFFPMCLFAFGLPLGTLAETITFPLREAATKMTCFLASNILGIGVIQHGTQIFEPNGAFSYEVAAACSGLRSLTAVLALATIYAFTSFNHPAKRVLIIASAFPLAVAGNVVRLSSIIIASDAFGQKWGQWVHDSSWFSMLPYIPAFIGLALVGFLLRDKKQVSSSDSTSTPTPTPMPPMQQPA